MRILHINCNYLRSTLHQTMIEYLNGLGYDNQVFVPIYHGSEQIIEPADYAVVSECFKYWDRILFDYKQSKIIKACERQYDIASFDLIHAYTLFTDGNAARVLSKKYGVPYVAAIRNTDVNDFFAKLPFLRSRGVKTMLDAKRVFYLSEAYKNTVFTRFVPEKYHSSLDRKTDIIPNGIDPFWLSGAAKKQSLGDPVRLIYAGGIDRNKNIGATQQAMEILREEGIKTTLTAVGKIVEKDVYDQIIKDGYTTYHEPVRKEKLADLYRQHDIFVMPSFAESFGLVYAEALSCGLPVIYSEGQGFDKQFDEGYVGYHVDSRSPKSIANVIKKIIEQYPMLSGNAPSAAKKYDWRSLTQRYSAIYSEIVKQI